MIRNLNNIATGWLNYIKGELGILSEEIKQKAEARLKICETCEFRVKNSCGQCGCILTAKTKDPNSVCPKSKW